MVVFGQIGSIWAKCFHFGKTWLYLSKIGCIWTNWFYLGKLVVFGQIGCIRAKLVVWG